MVDFSNTQQISAGMSSRLVPAMQSKYNTDDLRICETKEVIPPDQVHNEMPMSENAAKTILHARESIHRILSGQDDRLLVIVGPCSIHDTNAAHEYAQKLKEVKESLKYDLLIVIHVYF